MKISVVIPTFNEEKNVLFLYSQLKRVLNATKKPYEILFVDDGSSDNTFNNIQKLNKKDKKVKALKLRKNFGQTAAMRTGFNNAS